MVRLQNTGIYRIYNLKAAPKQSEGTTKGGPGLRVINFVDPCVLKSNHRGAIVPLQLLVTRKQHENVVIISSSITWLLINLSNAHQ